jgi:hypothetical protein
MSGAFYWNGERRNDFWFANGHIDLPANDRLGRSFAVRQLLVLVENIGWAIFEEEPIGSVRMLTRRLQPLEALGWLYASGYPIPPELRRELPPEVIGTRPPPVTRRCPVVLQGERNPVLVSGRPLLMQSGNPYRPTPDMLLVLEALVQDCCAWGEGLTAQDMGEATGGRLNHPHKVLWELRAHNDHWASVYIVIIAGCANNPGRYGIRPPS